MKQSRNLPRTVVLSLLSILLSGGAISRTAVSQTITGEFTLRNSDSVVELLNVPLGKRLTGAGKLAIRPYKDTRTLYFSAEMANPTADAIFACAYIALFDSRGQLILCTAAQTNFRPSKTTNLVGWPMPATADCFDRVSSYQLAYYERDNSNATKATLPDRGQIDGNRIQLPKGRQNAILLDLGKQINCVAHLFASESGDVSAEPYFLNRTEKTVLYEFQVALLDENKSLLCCGRHRSSLKPGSRGNGSLRVWLPPKTLSRVSDIKYTYFEDTPEQ